MCDLSWFKLSLILCRGRGGIKQVTRGRGRGKFFIRVGDLCVAQRLRLRGFRGRLLSFMIHIFGSCVISGCRGYRGARYGFPPGCCEALIHGRFYATLFVAISHNVLCRVSPIARNRLSCVFKIYFDSLSHDATR